MEVGTITAVKDKYGFIACAGFPKDVFFHAEDLDGIEFGPHLLNMNVTFEVSDSGKGPRAQRVRAAEK